MSIVLDYYSTLGQMSDPRKYAALYSDLPRDIPSLVRIVQGLLIHIFWAERYGLHLGDERKQEVNIRSAARELERILELDSAPLTVARPLEKRLVGNCRDFTLMLTSMLRHQGVPARARCGFGTYFMPNHYEDHWVCEYWNASEGRWVMVDAQLDEFQQRALDIDFNPLDMPPGKFVTGGWAWKQCRAGKDDPEKFGIFDLHGMWFIRGDLGRDFAALSKMELLPWDGWGLIDKPDPEITTEENALLDHIAALTLNADESFAALRKLYEEDKRVGVPEQIRSYQDGGMITVELARE